MDPSAEIEIDAPLELIWQVMLDTGAYGEWNSFVPRVELTQAQVGEPIVLHAMWADGSQSRSVEQVTALEVPASDGDGTTTAVMSYRYRGAPSRLGLVRSTRHQRLTRRADAPVTTYSTVLHLSGPLARFAGPGRIADGLRRHAADLKRRAEALARQ